MRVEQRRVPLPNGETQGYRVRPGGDKVVLLIHGNMTSSLHWDVVLEKMDRRFTLYAVDLRGFGESTYHRPIASLADFADDVRQFLDVVGLSRVSVVGWSTGGGVAMELAANWPERVEKLVLLASVSTRGYPFYAHDSEGLSPGRRLRTKEEIARDPGKTLPILTAYQKKDKAFLRALWEALIYTRNRPPEERYERYLDDMLTQRNLVDVYHALNMFNISTVHNGVVPGSGRVNQIVAPTLVVWGRQDLVVTEAMTREIVEDFGGRVRLVVLDGCGHSPLIDDLPALLRVLTEFLLGEEARCN